jgi:hypothetical protein
MRLFILLNLVFLSLCSFAQNTYDMSAPIDIPEDGYNKVLLMKNGNTLLLHFENRKGIRVKVFDTTHKEVANQKHLCNVIDINALDETYFDGLFEIGGEAVLFVTQQIENRRTIVRLRFDAGTGKLIKEEKLKQAPSYVQDILPFILKAKNKDEYNLVCFTRKSSTEAIGQVKLTRYNNKHEMVKEWPLDFTDEKFDYLALTGFTIDMDGNILLSTQLSKIVNYPDIMDKYLRLFYLADGAEKFNTYTMDLPRDVNSISTNFTYNKFADNLNILVESEWVGRVEMGLAYKYGLASSTALIIARSDFSSVIGDAIHFKKAAEYLQAHTNPKRKFNPSAISMYTNKLGLTTAVTIERDFTKGNVSIMDRDNTLNRNIGIVQYDDVGEEIWGTVLPRQSLTLTNGTFKEVLHRDFEVGIISYQFIPRNDRVFVLFNERSQNFDNVELTQSIDSTYRAESRKYNYEHTNAVYYTLNRKKEVTKNYLSGKPEPGEYRHMYAGSGNYIEETNTLTTLVLNKKGDKNTIHIAWCRL